MVLTLVISACTAAPAAITPTAAPAAKPTPAAAPPATGPAAASAGDPQAAARAALANIQPLAQPVTIELAVNSNVLTTLPLFIALDRDYFKDVGIQVNVIKYSGSSTTQLPLLARGDIDIAQAATTPALYNQSAQGFDVKLVSAVDRATPGRQQIAWMTVPKDQAGQFKTLADLRGKVVDGGSGQGTPISLLVEEALDLAGLTPGQDVTLRFNGKTPPDMITLAQNRAADVIGMNEPTASQADAQGLVARWKSTSDVAPWYQGSPLAMSSGFLKNHPEGARKFLDVYLIAAREVNASNGQWTDDLLPTAMSWSGFSADVIKNQGGPPLYERNGTISLDYLKRLQDRWQKDGQLQQMIDVQSLIDSQVLDNALQDVGRVPEQ
jgi:ABC-type nitrate/sulfonate/bicarbonate transport system substrate-binding protein